MTPAEIAAVFHSTLGAEKMVLRNKFWPSENTTITQPRHDRDTTATEIWLEPPKRDTTATETRHQAETENIVNQWLAHNRDTAATRTRHGMPQNGPKRDTRHTPMYRSVVSRRDAPAERRALDWSDLGDDEFKAALGELTRLDELEGVANRRQLFNQPGLARWSEAQRRMLYARKAQLEARRDALALAANAAAQSRRRARWGGPTVHSA